MISTFRGLELSAHSFQHSACNPLFPLMGEYGRLTTINSNPSLLKIQPQIVKEGAGGGRRVRMSRLPQRSATHKEFPAPLFARLGRRGPNDATRRAGHQELGSLTAVRKIE
jgi:hypothetical protein